MSVKKPKSEKVIKPGSLEFRKLQDKWYRKLKKTGFDDIEVIEDRSGLLRNGTDQPKWGDQRVVLLGEFRRDNPNTLASESIFIYYQLIRIFLSHGKFRSKIHKKALKLYETGITYRDIAAIFHKTRRKHLPRSVWYVSQLMSDNKQDMLTFHLTHPEGEYLHAIEVPAILDPSYSPHLKTKRGKSKY